VQESRADYSSVAIVLSKELGVDVGSMDQGVKKACVHDKEVEVEVAEQRYPVRFLPDSVGDSKD
jgi:hypothetical protein